MAAAIASVLLFAISLLAVLPAPTYTLWMLAIVISEYPWVTAMVASGFTFFNYLSNGPSHWTTLLTGTVVVLMLSPLLMAVVISRTLPENMNTAFPKRPAPASVRPFELAKMFGPARSVSPLSVAYFAHGASALKVDFYPSAESGIRPCVLVVHGGSWRSGDNKQLPELNSELATRGYHVAAINYRLAPDHQFPSQVEDVRKAIDFLKQNATPWHIDTTKFVLLGRSAGAQIALMAAYTLNDPSIKGVIDFYGPADMVWGYSIPSNPLIMDSRKVMSDYLGGSYDANPKAFSTSSPVRFVSASNPWEKRRVGCLRAQQATQRDVIAVLYTTLFANAPLGDARLRLQFARAGWSIVHLCSHTVSVGGNKLIIKRKYIA